MKQSKTANPFRDPVTPIVVEKIKPRVFAQKCPVCSGYGKVGFQERNECHGCKGRGWIVLYNNESREEF